MNTSTIPESLLLDELAPLAQVLLQVLPFRKLYHYEKTNICAGVNENLTYLKTGLLGRYGHGQHWSPNERFGSRHTVCEYVFLSETGVIVIGAEWYSRTLIYDKDPADVNHVWRHLEQVTFSALETRYTKERVRQALFGGISRRLKVAEAALRRARALSQVLGG